MRRRSTPPHAFAPAGRRRKHGSAWCGVRDAVADLDARAPRRPAQRRERSGHARRLSDAPEILVCVDVELAIPAAVRALGGNRTSQSGAGAVHRDEDDVAHWGGVVSIPWEARGPTSSRIRCGGRGRPEYRPRYGRLTQFQRICCDSATSPETFASAFVSGISACEFWDNFRTISRNERA